MISVSVSLCYLPIKSSEFMAHRSWKFGEKQRYLSGWLEHSENSYTFQSAHCAECSRQEEKGLELCIILWPPILHLSPSFQFVCLFWHSTIYMSTVQLASKLSCWPASGCNKSLWCNLLKYLSLTAGNLQSKYRVRSQHNIAANAKQVFGVQLAMT